MSEFKNRVFGCAIVKAINSNYNADFTHQPRTLPDGVVYATDKAFKYSIRHYLKNNYPQEKILFYKRLNPEMNPLTLAESYQELLGDFEKESKAEILQKLLNCLDVKFFGATFAAKSKTKTVNLSIHGPVQINHGVNRYPQNEIFSEQIMSPFRNPGDKEDAEKGMTTLGQQSKLREGHYVHHFSVNPQNLASVCKLAGGHSGLTDADIQKLKEAMCSGVTYFDSASKAGSDNELLLWVQLKENSKMVLPVFTELISVKRTADKVAIDFSGVKEILNEVYTQLEAIEVYYTSQSTNVLNLPENTRHFEIINIKENRHEG
jgi:CRISPR-associated protein Csh2